MLLKDSLCVLGGERNRSQRHSPRWRRPRRVKSQRALSPSLSPRLGGSWARKVPAESRRLPPPDIPQHPSHSLSRPPIRQAQPWPWLFTAIGAGRPPAREASPGTAGLLRARTAPSAPAMMLHAAESFPCCQPVTHSFLSGQPLPQTEPKKEPLPHSVPTNTLP